MENASFRAKILELVAHIPRGKTLTYKQVAEQAGNPKAARAVGTIMRHNYDPAIPCHRVVRSDGAPGGYNRGGASAKRRILREEGADLTVLNFAH